MDINGDGVQDILSGSYSRKSREMAGLFQVLYGQGEGKFSEAAVLKGSDDQPLIIPIDSKNQLTQNICTRPSAVDWDGDNDLDLVVGNFAGSFYVFLGEGKGKFNPKPQAIKVDGQPLKIKGVHSDPMVVDWDKDGDNDLLSGSSNGGVQWAENTAGKGAVPKLTAFKQLIQPGGSVPYGSILNEDELKGPTTSTRIWVDDVNEDGKWDIFVGDSLTLSSPAKGLSPADVKKKLVQWQKDVHAANLEVREAGQDAAKRQKAMQAYQKVYAQKKDFITEQRTGFVWLYVQK